MLGDLGKLIVAKDFKNLPKVQKIARSGHTGCPAEIEKFLSLCWHSPLQNPQTAATLVNEP